MKQDAFWELFADTGDPVGYLLYCAWKRQEKPKDAMDAVGMHSGGEALPAYPGAESRPR